MRASQLILGIALLGSHVFVSELYSKHVDEVGSQPNRMQVLRPGCSLTTPKVGNLRLTIHGASFAMTYHMVVAWHINGGIGHWHTARRR